MYPRLSDIFKDLFGITLPIPNYSLGAMVAVAVLTAMWLTRKELDRMYEIARMSTVRMLGYEGYDARRPPAAQQYARPSALLGTVTVLAVVLGIAGSKLFHILENLDDFSRDPFGMIFSTGGLSFYGGLILAGLGIAWYVRSKGVKIWA